MMLHRKRLPDRLMQPHDEFVCVVELVERAKRAITHAVPTTRFAGRPFAEALADYEDALTSAAELMIRWRVADVEDQWLLCDASVNRGLEKAAKIRREAPEIGGFERIVGLADELIGALEPFGEAERAFDRLRTSQN